MELFKTQNIIFFSNKSQNTRQFYYFDPYKIIIANLHQKMYETKNGLILRC
jgi:hypothetical protein